MAWGTGWLVQHGLFLLGWWHLCVYNVVHMTGKSGQLASNSYITTWLGHRINIFSVSQWLQAMPGLRYWSFWGGRTRSGRSRTGYDCLPPTPIWPWDQIFHNTGICWTWKCELLHECPHQLQWSWTWNSFRAVIMETRQTTRPPVSMLLPQQPNITPIRYMGYMCT